MKNSKIKINIGIIGYLPFEFDKGLIKNHSSDIFEIVGEIDDYHFNGDSDTDFWGYSDQLLNSEIPTNSEADFLLVLLMFQLKIIIMQDDLKTTE